MGVHTKSNVLNSRESTYKLINKTVFTFVLAIVSVSGNVTLTTASVNGQAVNTSDPSVQADLQNKSSSLYISLVNKYEPEVRPDHLCNYCLSV